MKFTGKMKQTKSKYRKERQKSDRDWKRAKK